MDSPSGTTADPNIRRVVDIQAASSIDKASLRKEFTIPDSLRILTDPWQDISTLSSTISSGLKLPQLSPDTTERVFPIRSVVSVDSCSTPSSALQTPSLECSEHQISPFSDSSWCFPNPTESDNPGGQPVFPANDDTKHNVSAGPVGSGDEQKHDFAGQTALPGTVPDNLANSVYSPTKFPDSIHRKIESPNENNINLPHLGNLPLEHEGLGVAYKLKSQLKEIQKARSVYSFGILTVLRESEGKLTVQVSSQNTEEIIGHTPEELFGLDSFCDIMRPEQIMEFMSHTKSIRDKSYNVEQHGPDVLDLIIVTRNGSPRNFWCTMHATKDSPQYIICEIEPQKSSMDSLGCRDDSNYAQPIHKTTASTGHDRGDDTLEALRVFRMLRGSQNGFEYSSILNAVSRIIQLTASAQSIDILFSRATRILKELTGFNRATVYRFDSDWNGIAVTDLADPSYSGDSYENMHFLGPVFSEDLQTLHLKNKVRVSYNHTQQCPAKLIYRESTSAPQLDTNFCYLSMGSPAPLELLSRTPVEACLSIRINVFGKLWGLVTCKSYVRGARLLPPLQKLCWLISDTLSSNIERLSYTLPFQMVEERRPIKEAAKTEETFGVDILSLFGADYAASSIVGETKILGKPLDSQEVLALVEYLRMRQLDTILWSTDIGKDFQDLSYPPSFKYISGLLFIPLSADGRDFIIFFRTSQWKEITWVGCSKHNSDNEARASCIPGKGNILCRPDGWSAVDQGKASVLSLIYKTFTDVWRQKETAVQNTQLMKLLLANCAHEFRTPLNAIINYLEIALDGSLSQETRDNLSRSHSASKSLIYIINDLLDLTNAENGQSLIKDEIFDLSGTIREATHIFGEEAKQKNVDLYVLEHTELPLVLGDQRRVRQVIMNLISNAIQHTSNGSVVIESCVPPDVTGSDTIGVEVAIHDTGSGMSQDAVEALFCELEEVSNEDYLQNSQCCRSKIDDTVGESKNVLGLGLALVARIVRNMDGRLTLKSEKGTGSCFKIKLRFPLPSDGQQSASQRTSNGERESHYGADKGNARKAPRGYPEICNDTRPAGPMCDNECSSQQTEKENNTDSDIRVAISTESSELLHQSNVKSSNNQCTGESVSKPESSRTPIPSSKPEKLIKGLPKVLDQADASNDEPQSMTTANKSQQKLEQSPTANLSITEVTKSDANATPTTKSSLRVLVAEDDPINSAIVRKRLEKQGHTVHLTVNGKECVSAYRANAGSFDALLMDIQMPIVDGIGATKLIREYEEATENLARFDGNRIPIFAVSASLMEKDRQMYIDSGFDGWIMKPIDFKRVSHILAGVCEDEVRDDSIYVPGMWDKGGWFEKRILDKPA